MPDLNPLYWRPMTEADLDRVAAIAVLGFPDHFEGRPMFANRLALAAQGCFVLAAKEGPGEGDESMGYAIAYPWRLDSAPPLNTLIEAIPADAEVIYLHDLALHPEARGTGATKAIVERLADQARAKGWPAIALVAVNDAAGFWGKHGFTVRENAAVAEKLASYGSDARYMIRPL
jgi:GNAT superfamily N-acetyltransferase